MRSKRFYCKECWNDFEDPATIDEDEGYIREECPFCGSELFVRGFVCECCECERPDEDRIRQDVDICHDCLSSFVSSVNEFIMDHWKPDVANEMCEQFDFPENCDERNTTKYE